VGKPVSLILFLASFLTYLKRFIEMIKHTADFLIYNVRETILHMNLLFCVDVESDIALRKENEQYVTEIFFKMLR
jgi:hypothetical protein